MAVLEDTGPLGQDVSREALQATQREDHRKRRDVTFSRSHSWFGCSHSRTRVADCLFDAVLPSSDASWFLLSPAPWPRLLLSSELLKNLRTTTMMLTTAAAMD